MTDRADLRRRAENIVADWKLHFDSDRDDVLINMIEASLAFERERARAPFLALAKWLDTTDDSFVDDPSYIAEIIRYAVELEQ